MHGASDRPHMYSAALQAGRSVADIVILHELLDAAAALSTLGRLMETVCDRAFRLLTKAGTQENLMMA